MNVRAGICKQTGKVSLPKLPMCCQFVFKDPRTKQAFVPLVLLQDAGKVVTISLRNGKLEKTFGGEHSSTFSQRSEARRQREPKWVYQDSYPDAPKAPPKGKGGKEDSAFRPPGVYRDVSTDTWYRLDDWGQRRPMTEKKFWHPFLKRVVQVSESAVFTELDGQEIPQGEVVDGEILRLEPAKQTKLAEAAAPEPLEEEFDYDSQ